MRTRAQQGRAGKAAIPWPQLPTLVAQRQPQGPSAKGPGGQPTLRSSALALAPHGSLLVPTHRGGSEVSSPLTSLKASCPATRRAPSLGPMGGMG